MSLDLTPGHGDLLGRFYWEMISPWRGGSSTRNTGPAPPNAGAVSTLSQILQDQPPRRYYLSRRACLGILRRAAERGKDLPPRLAAALMAQAGLAGPDAVEGPDVQAYHINQRNEGIDLGGVAGALMRTQNMQMQTFVIQASGVVSKGDGGCFLLPECHPALSGGGGQAGQGYPCVLTAGFSAGAGPSAGSVGYQEEVAPTLKAASGGGMMPAILCLNDQGGSSMDCSEEVSGTLRSQEHGHQPLVFDSHGKDARYTGPLAVAPTVVTAYGTGGNNTPLVAQGRSAPLLLRRLTPLECERLQGFPDGFTALPSASDTARYKALGNSVAIPCVEFVMQGIAWAVRSRRDPNFTMEDI